MDVISTLRTSLSERYDIQREIGAGGMATVCLARDLRHDRAQPSRDSSRPQAGEHPVAARPAGGRRRHLRCGSGRPIVTLFSDRNNFELVLSPNWITEFRQRIAASERTSRR